MLLRDFIALCKALISDIRAERAKRALYIIETKPKTIGTKIRGGNENV